MLYALNRGRTLAGVLAASAVALLSASGAALSGAPTLSSAPLVPNSASGNRLLSASPASHYISSRPSGVPTSSPAAPPAQALASLSTITPPTAAAESAAS